MEASNHITMFPLELVQAVFDNLSSTDLKSALLVCSRFRRAGEDKKYWSWVTLDVTTSNLSVMPHVLATGRLQSMKELSLTAVSEELLKAVDSHPGLSVLSVSDCDVSSVEPNLFAKIVGKMEEVYIYVQLTEVQIQEIFNSVNSESKLKKLVIQDNDLTSVDSETLARAITAMECVAIYVFDSEMTLLTPLQCDTIFKFASNGTKLEALGLSGIDLSSVNPEIMASVVSSLERVAMNDSNLTSQQCKQIFIQLSRDSKVKVLHMSDNDLTEVDPDLMVGVMSKIEIEILELKSKGDGEISSQQWKTIFEKLNSDCILEELDISDHYLDEVDPKDLARIIPNLEAVSLHSTLLRSSQSEAIFKSITCESKIKKLKMSDNDLSSVNPEFLARAILNLEEVDLSYEDDEENEEDEENEDAEDDEEMGYTGLSAQQCQVIFQCLSQDSKKLKKLNMKGNNLELVNPETIAKVSAKLELNM